MHGRLYIYGVPPLSYPDVGRLAGAPLPRSVALGPLILQLLSQLSRVPIIGCAAARRRLNREAGPAAWPVRACGSVHTWRRSFVPQPHVRSGVALRLRSKWK